jgi:hypothetical protein
MPFTIPVLTFTVAMLTLLLLQVPPPETSLKIVVAPIHTLLVPVMVDTVALTVNIIVATAVPQPLLKVYLIVSIPAVRPLTVPLKTVACELLALHVPPLIPLVNVIEAPTFTTDVPVIVPALGDGLTATVTIWVFVQPLAVSVYTYVTGIIEEVALIRVSFIFPIPDAAELDIPVIDALVQENAVLAVALVGK